MQLDEAKQLARSLAKIANVQVLGVKANKKGEKGEKTLVISINRRGKIAVNRYPNALGKIAALAGVHGERWQTLNVCSTCHRRLRAKDGHYHEKRVVIGAEPVCCRCSNHE